MAKNPSKNAAGPKTRPISFQQFNRQLDELGIGNLQEVELGEHGSIFIRLANNIDAPDADEFRARIEAAEDSKDVAMIVLDYYPDATAEEQWEKFEAAGGTPDRLAALWAAATADQQERLGKMRPRRA